MNKTTKKATQYTAKQQHPRQHFFPKKNELPQVGFEPTTLCSLDECSAMHIDVVMYMYTVEPLIMDTPKSRQPPYNGQTVRPLPIYCPYISTSEEGTTSKQWTKCSSPTCPLFGGSTVYYTTHIMHPHLTLASGKLAAHLILVHQHSTSPAP